MNDQYLKTKQSQTEELKGRAPRHPTIRAIGPNHPLSMLPPPPPPPPRENSVADVASRDVDVDVDMDVDDVSKDSPSKNTGVSSFYLDKFEPEYFSGSSEDEANDEQSDDEKEDVSKNLTSVHSHELDEVNEFSLDLDSLINQVKQGIDNNVSLNNHKHGNFPATASVATRSVALDVDSILAEAEDLLSDFSGSSDGNVRSATTDFNAQHVSLSSMLGKTDFDGSNADNDNAKKTLIISDEANSAQVLEKILAEKDLDETSSHASSELLPCTEITGNNILDQLNDTTYGATISDEMDHVSSSDDGLNDKLCSDATMEVTKEDVPLFNVDIGCDDVIDEHLKNLEDGVSSQNKDEQSDQKKSNQCDDNESNSSSQPYSSSSFVPERNNIMNHSDALVEIGSDENITLLTAKLRDFNEGDSKHNNLDESMDEFHGIIPVEKFFAPREEQNVDHDYNSAEKSSDNEFYNDDKDKEKIEEMSAKLEALSGSNFYTEEPKIGTNSQDLLTIGDLESKRNDLYASEEVDVNRNSISQQPLNNSINTSQTNRSKSTEDLSNAVLPDALMFVRQKIESLSLFDSDMMRLAATGDNVDNDEDIRATQESFKRSFQQSISAAVLVSLAHKRYERRRLGAMEIEKIVRSLAQQSDFDRIRAILLLLSDDYVRSSNEDARKGGVVALAACAIGLKKADENHADVMECKDLILASVVHCCQDHSQRVRYYATESLFNVVKVIPSLAVQHFFILFEILRSLYADVDHDVRSGAQLLDKKLKEVIVMATNNGSFLFETCVPLFTRFIHMTNKPTKKLTLTWLQEFVEKVLGSPILEFLHLFLGGVFELLADASPSIRELALSFLEIVLPKLEVYDDQDFEVASSSSVADFDKIIQVLVQTMEHPDPLVRKAVMYWISRIVHAHIDGEVEDKPADEASVNEDRVKYRKDSPASLAVRNSLPHMLPGVLLSIGDIYDIEPNDSIFLPNFSTRSLAEQTNKSLQNAVIREGSAFVSHLEGLTLALREELDTPGGISSKNAPAIKRKPFRADANPDGTGIESAGWFRTGSDTNKINEDGVISRLCALQWVNVIYENVVPVEEKAQHSKKFIVPIIQSLIWSPPNKIIFKSLEVLANITVPQGNEIDMVEESNICSSMEYPSILDREQFDLSAKYSLEMLDPSSKKMMSRDREVFSVLVSLYSYHPNLLSDLSKVIRYMCTLQPPEFIFVSFALEINDFVTKSKESGKDIKAFSRDLEFVSVFVQQINHVMLTAKETSRLRGDILFNCIGVPDIEQHDERKLHLFNILLHSFSHNFVATLTLCLWVGAYQTASIVLHSINRMEINLKFFMELDVLIELIERPLFRRLHFKLLEVDESSNPEGSGSMLFRTLKSILLILPQSKTYETLKARLVSVAYYRESVRSGRLNITKKVGKETLSFVNCILEARRLHTDAAWNLLRAESLESFDTEIDLCKVDIDKGRRDWVGYNDADEEISMKMKIRAIKGGEINARKDFSNNTVSNSELDSLPVLPEDEGIDTNQEKSICNDDADEKPLLRYPHKVFRQDKSSLSEQRNIDDPSAKIVEQNHDGQINEWKEFWT